MTQTHDYALLAAASYADIRLLPDNQAPIPPGWTELTQYAISKSGGNGSFLSSGLSARVYQGPGGKIVISLAGTEFAASAGAAADFLSGNIPLAFGRAPKGCLAEHVCCQFKSRIRGQRSCRKKKATARGHVPGHASPFPGISSNEALQ